MILPETIAAQARAVQLREGGATPGLAQLFFWMALLLVALYVGLPFLMAHLATADTFFLTELLRRSRDSQMLVGALSFGLAWWPLALWGWLRVRVACAPLSRRNLHGVLHEYGLLNHSGGRLVPALARLVFGQGVLRAVIDIRWIHCPPVGEASAENPAVLAIQKSPRIRRAVFEEATFWGGIRGVRSHLATVDGADLADSGTDDFFFLLLSDRLSNLPDKLGPGGLPDPAELPTGKFPVGLNAFREVHYVDFTKRPNALICGGSGSGKTVVTQWVVHCLARQGLTVTAIDPDSQFDALGLDPDFQFASRATAFEAFTPLLRAEQAEMEARNRGERPREARVLVIDELPKVLEAEENLAILRDLAQRMRKQRMALVVVMQNPAAEILPPSIRDNFYWKLCGKLDNPQEVANLFPGVANAADAVAQIQAPGCFLKATKTDLELITTPFDPRLEPTEEGW